jgi:hypothetical protein
MIDQVNNAGLKRRKTVEEKNAMPREGSFSASSNGCGGKR